jgi:hypothetical protein
MESKVREYNKMGVQSGYALLDTELVLRRRRSFNQILSSPNISCSALDTDLRKRLVKCVLFFQDINGKNVAAYIVEMAAKCFGVTASKCAIFLDQRPLGEHYRFQSLFAVA